MGITAPLAEEPAVNAQFGVDEADLPLLPKNKRRTVDTRQILKSAKRFDPSTSLTKH